MRMALRVSEPYSAVGRKLLHIAKDYEGDLIVTRDPWSKSYIASVRGAVPSVILEGKEIVVNTFQIATHPTSKKGPDAEQLLKDGIVRGYDSIARQEDSEIFKLINSAVPADHSVNARSPRELEYAIWEAISLVNEHENSVRHITMHPTIWALLRALKCSFVTLSPNSDCVGFWDSKYPIHTSTMCPKNAIYFTGMPESLGVLAIKQDAIDVRDVDCPKELKCRVHEDAIGQVIWEDIGILIVNDYCIGRVLTTFKTSIARNQITQDHPGYGALADLMCPNIADDVASYQEYMDHYNEMSWKSARNRPAYFTPNRGPITDEELEAIEEIDLNLDED